MIRVTELLVSEDTNGEVNKLEFKTVQELIEYGYFYFLMSQGEHIIGTSEYKDNGDEQIDREVVGEFLKTIEGKRGVMYVWSVEYDCSYWFIEIDSEHYSELLTQPNIPHEDYGVIDCSSLREITQRVMGL